MVNRTPTHSVRTPHGFKTFDLREPLPPHMVRSIWLVVDASLKDDLIGIKQFLNVDQNSFFQFELEQRMTWKPNSLASYLMRDKLNPNCTHLKSVNTRFKLHLRQLESKYPKHVLCVTPFAKELKHYLLDVSRCIMSSSGKEPMDCPLILPDPILAQVNSIVVVTPLE